MRAPIYLLLTLIWLTFNAHAQAQAHADWYERAAKAYEEKRYDDALAAYEWILDKEPDNAQVRYLLARTQLDMGDGKEAQRSINRALSAEPDNIAFMELLLETGFPREPMEIVRRTRKDDLSAKILELDSLNAPANFQLGIGQVGEWMDWRNRLEVDEIKSIASILGNLQPTQENISAEAQESTKPVSRNVNNQNPFDLQRWETMGHNVINLSPRADKAYPRAIEYLEKVLLRDPKHEGAYINLASLYVTAPDMHALQLLAGRMRQSLPENHNAWLFSGYALHQQGSEKVATDYYEEAFKVMPESLLVVFQDVNQLMNKEGLKDFVAADLSPEQYWEFRDPRHLTPENERMVEHYSRIVYSDLIFGEPKLNLAGRDSERGNIYIRYGQPRSEYFLNNEIANCGNASYRNFHIFEYSQQKFVFGNLFPNLNQYVFYSPCSQVMAAAVGMEVDFEIIARENIREMPEAYYYEMAGKRVDFPYQTSLFKGKDGNVDLYVPYGIPVQFDAMTMSKKLGLHAGAFLLSESDGLIGEDHTRAQDIRAKDLTLFQAAALWIDTHNIEAAPGTYDLSIEFETESGGGMGFYRNSIDIPGFDGSNLQLSDLLLAYIVEEAGPDETEPPTGMLMRDGLMIRPAPWGVFNREQPMYLFFEMYNLQKDAEGRARYEVEAVMVEQRDAKGLEKILDRAFRGRAREGVSVRFQNTTTNSDESQYLIMDAVDQPPGTYVIVMRVHDSIANRTQETRRIVLLE